MFVMRRREEAEGERRMIGFGWREDDEEPETGLGPLRIDMLVDDG